MTSLFIKLRNCFKNIFLPTLTLGAYLFYILWSAPVSIIMQEYTITSWFIINNPLTPIILIVILLITLLLFTFYKFNIISAYNTLIGFILFIFILSFLYNYIFPYNYGSFIDNNTLTPEKPLLGFSKWYYLLDIGFISLSLYLVFISIKKKVFIPFFLSFFILYSTENIITISKVSNSMKSSSDNVFQKYTLSKNKKNVLLLVFDGFDPRVVRYFLTNNSLTDDHTNWSKDFIFYDNVTALGRPTAGSASSMFQGYSRSSQFILQDIITNSYPSGYFYHTPIVQFNERLEKNNVDSSYLQTGLVWQLPILSIYPYRSIPYISRSLIANNNSWKFNSLNSWTSSQSSLVFDTNTFKITNTTNNNYAISWSQYSHCPWNSTNQPISIEDSATSLENMEILRQHNSKDIFEYITHVIQFLKKQNIYNDTKIIITSDHGSHGGIKIRSFLSKISKDYPKDLTATFQASPSLLMIKDFNTTQSKMIIDNRFLSLADLPGILEHSLELATTNTDYSKELPPKRIFNIPNIHLVLSLDSQKKMIEKLKQENSIEFVQISNIHPFKESFFNVPLTDITNIPAYEIIE